MTWLTEIVYYGQHCFKIVIYLVKDLTVVLGKFLLENITIVRLIIARSWRISLLPHFLFLEWIPRVPLMDWFSSSGSQRTSILFAPCYWFTYNKFLISLRILFVVSI